MTIDFDAPSSIEDHDGNGIPELEVKFSRAAMQSTLGSGDDVPVTVTGFLAGGASFVGVDHVRVIGVHVLAPAKGSHLIAGSVSQVRWETPPDLTVQWLAILQSLDGGATWSLGRQTTAQHGELRLGRAGARPPTKREWRWPWSNPPTPAVISWTPPLG